MKNLNFSQVAAMNEHFILQTLESFLDCAVCSGVHNIELWAGLPHLYAPDMTPDKVKRIREKIRERELELICYTPEQCIYPYNIAAREEGLREYSITYFMKNLEIASELDAPMFQIVPGWGYRNEPRTDALERSMDSIRCIVERAEKLGIRVVLEALEEEESNLIRTSSELKEVLDILNMPNLGAIIDTCPMAAAGEDFVRCHEILGKKIWHTHFIDRQHLAWGDGDLPMVSYLEQLDRFDYKGYLTLEVLNDRYLLYPEKALGQGIAEMKKYLA